MIEFVLTQEALFWFKIGGWLMIGGGATWAIASIWSDTSHKNGWQDVQQKSRQDNTKRHQT